MRIGKFRLADSLVRKNPWQVAEVFALMRMIPVHVESRFESMELEYVALSPYFEECPEGSEPRTYSVSLGRKDGAVVVALDGEPVGFGWPLPESAEAEEGCARDSSRKPRNAGEVLGALGRYAMCGTWKVHDLSLSTAWVGLWRDGKVVASHTAVYGQPIEECVAALLAEMGGGLLESAEAED